MGQDDGDGSSEEKINEERVEQHNHRRAPHRTVCDARTRPGLGLASGHYMNGVIRQQFNPRNG